jgi:hypothetical protein
VGVLVALVTASSEAGPPLRQVLRLDLMSDARYDRDGSDLISRGLYLDRRRGYHVFRCAIRYPLTEGRIVLRTDLDWDRDVEATSVTDEVTTFTFELEEKRPSIYFKPCWILQALLERRRPDGGPVTTTR